jgi:glycosyltransferase involved in cell wall biosynthesis
VAAPDTESDVAFKGHDVLLGAIAALDRRDVRAVIVGHDPGPSFRERAAANGVSESVTVLGRVPEIGPYMAAFDVLVVPSTRYESLPLVVLEAMAAGTPVIASRLSGIPEAVVDDESGYTFEPGESSQLADLLARCVEDRALVKRLGVGARRLYEARFGAQRMVDETLGLYRELQVTQ